MSTLKKIGSLLWIADKLKEVADLTEIVQNATDPVTREQAAFNAATKLAETVGIGIPLWFIDKALTTTGLDRVFDSLKKNKSFEAYLEDQIAKKNLRDVGLGTIAEWGLHELREWISLNGHLDPLFDSFFDLEEDWNTAKHTVSPLILDLDGDGLVETQSKTDGIYFDHAGDGFAEATGWAGADDGLLVRDLNSDGSINNGSELFGNNTRLSNGQNAANGFEALKDLDSNKDGKLNSADTAWNSLRVWKDNDADAQTDTGELLSLAEAGVKEVNLTYTNAGSNPDQFGNEHQQTSSYTTTAGTTRAIHDVWFTTNNWNTIDQRTPIELNSTVAAMPEVIGSGTLGSLRQAMMRDTTGQLISAVNAYLNNSNLAQRDSLLQEVLYRWVGVQDQDPTLRGPYLEDGRKLAVLEAFFGEKYEQLGGGDFGPTINDPGPAASMELLGLFDKVAARLGAQLDLQGRDAPFYNAISLNWNENTQEFSIDASGVETYVRESFVLRPQQALDNLRQFIFNLKALGSNEVLNALSATGNQYGDEIDQLLTSANWSWGTKGEDQLTADFSEDSRLFGWDGNDDLFGGNGNDTLDGGFGDDYLAGGAGADVYLFGRGSGQDIIYNYDTDAIGTNADTILLGQGISTTDVILRNHFHDLVISIKGTNDTLRVSSYFFTENDLGNVVENLKFADGTVWNFNTVKVKALQGTEGDDEIEGFSSADTIQAGGGNDKIYGNDGNDTLNGGAGNDYLDGGGDNDTLNGGTGHDSVYGREGADLLLGDAGNDYLEGGEGNDTLDGGAGSDSLYGGAGNNNYLFGKGDGQDTIWSDYDTSANRLNVLRFKAGVTPSEVIVTRSVYDELVLSIAGTTDKITVSNFFYDDNPANEYNPIQQISFADGTIWNIDTIKAKAITGNNTAQYLTGYNGNDTINALGGNDTVNGQAGNDTLNGGDGNDTISGGEGIDSLIGGTGSDYLDGGEGNDTLDGGAGSDSLYGGAGNNTYLFGKGDGQDTIWSDYDTAANKLNVLRLKAGVTPSEVIVTRTVYDELVLSIAGTTDKVTVSNFFYDDNPANEYNPIQQVSFADGTIWNIDTIKAKAITGNNTAQYLTGYNGNDTINALGGDDTVYGLGGNDYIDGGTGNDMMLGGLGNDTYVVDSTLDVVTENANQGTDTVWSSVTYTLTANVENLTLTGTAAINGTGNALNNVLTGNAAANTLNGGAGSDTMIGGIGNDIYVVNVATDVVTELANEGTDTVQASITYTLGNNVENLTLTGTAAINGTGNELNNVLTGNSANNTLTGGAGNDTLNGAGGSDTMVGGTGNDIYVVNVATDVVAELANEGTDTVQSSVTYTLAANVENLTLTGTKTINGTGNTLNNVLTGNAAANTLNGGAGNDRLNGGAGNDSLYGSDGNDRILGGKGNDVLYGGNGSDTFTFNRGDGEDTVYVSEPNGSNFTETLVLGNLNRADVNFLKYNNSLYVQQKGSTTDHVKIVNHFSGAANTLDKIIFADGLSWDAATINANSVQTVQDPETV